MATAKAQKVTAQVTTPVGILSFPRIFAGHGGKKKKDDGTEVDTYDIQIIIPKTDRAGLKAVVDALKIVGEAAYGERWRKVTLPLRDGDKEADEFTEDGVTTKGEKYPERAGCYFINARSTRPVPAVDRQRNLITEPSDVYGGCKGKINVEFYPYSVKGNTGIGASLNGVQKVADGEPFGASAPAIETMFDLLDGDEGDEDGLGLDEDEEPTPPPAKKAAAKKATAKKAVAKKVAEPEPEADEDEGLDDLDLGDEDEDDDLLDGLDDEDA